MVDFELINESRNIVSHEKLFNFLSAIIILS